MPERPLYLYGIVRSPAAIATPRRRGVAGAPVGVLEEDGLGAVVGELPSAGFDARPDDLIAHSDVLQDVVASAGVLPMRFGTVFTSPAELTEAFLRPNHDALVAMLDRMQGLVEVQVKASYDEEAIARDIASSDRTVQKLQARARQRGDVESKIELGRRFASVLEQKRYADGRRVVDAIAPLASQVSTGDAPGEYGVVDAAFLVARDDAPHVAAAVDDLNAAFGGRVTVRHVGPLPPYSFVDAAELVTA